MTDGLKKKMADRLQAAGGMLASGIGVAIVAAFGANSVLRSGGAIPDNALVAVVSDQSGNTWYRSIDHVLQGSVDGHSSVDVMTCAEAKRFGIEPHPDDMRSGRFFEERGFIHQLLINHGVFPSTHQWVVLQDGAAAWDNGDALSEVEQRRLYAY